MTIEEARLTLQENFGYLSEEHPRIIKAMRVAMNILSQFSFPCSVDEAAEKYAQKEYPDEPSCGQWGTGDYEPTVDMEYPREIAKEAFKARAEWMAGKDTVKKNTVEDKSLEIRYIRKDTVLKWAKNELENARNTDFDEFSRGGYYLGTDN